MATKQLSGSDIAAVIIDHVSRYRMTVFEALRRQPQLGSLPRKELKRELNRLCRERLLGREPLYRHRSYYYLAAADGADRPAGPLAETAKVRSYAMLAFCCLGRVKRVKLSADELERLYPGVLSQGRPLNYYLTTTGDEQAIGFLRVDSGGRSRWDRILAKCREDIERHRLNRYVRPLIEQRRFEITLVTALPQKAERLQRAMAAWTATPTTFVRLCVLPELLNLISPPAR